jgi:hypothetical protein
MVTNKGEDKSALTSHFFIGLLTYDDDEKASDDHAPRRCLMKRQP